MYSFRGKKKKTTIIKNTIFCLVNPKIFRASLQERKSFIEDCWWSINDWLMFSFIYSYEIDTCRYATKNLSFLYLMFLDSTFLCACVVFFFSVAIGTSATHDSNGIGCRLLSFSVQPAPVFDFCHNKIKPNLVANRLHKICYWQVGHVNFSWNLSSYEMVDQGKHNLDLHVLGSLGQPQLQSLVNLFRFPENLPCQCNWYSHTKTNNSVTVQNSDKP